MRLDRYAYSRKMDLQASTAATLALIVNHVASQDLALIIESYMYDSSTIYTERLINGFARCAVSRNEITNFLYCGGTPDGDTQYWERYKDGHPTLIEPAFTTICICGASGLVKNYYVSDGTKVIAIGSECIRKFIRDGRSHHCNVCNIVHRNRSDNLCTACRKKVEGTCTF